MGATSKYCAETGKGTTSRLGTVLPRVARRLTLPTMADLTTDVARRTALPTTSAKRAAPRVADENSDAYLDGIEEEWNQKVDVEMQTLAEGMVDLVKLASVRRLLPKPT